MKFDNVEISGKKYRIEFNWNAISAWMDITGHQFDDLTDVKNIKGAELTELCYQGIVEGCRLEGMEFPFTVKDLGATMSPITVASFMKVFTTHMSAMTAVVNSKKK
jgi:hypothetical protein